jgi:hypothetical protein
MIGHTFCVTSPLLGTHLFAPQITMTLNKLQSLVLSLTHIWVSCWPYKWNKFDSLSSCPPISSLTPSPTIPAFDDLYSAMALASPTHAVFYLDDKTSLRKSFVAFALCAKLQPEICVPRMMQTIVLNLSVHERWWTPHSAFGIPVSQMCSYL